MKNKRKIQIGGSEEFWNKVEEFTGADKDNQAKAKFMKLLIVFLAVVGVLYIINGIRLLAN